MRLIGTLLLIASALIAFAGLSWWALPNLQRAAAQRASAVDEKPLTFFAARSADTLRFNIAGHSGWAVLRPAMEGESTNGIAYRLKLRVLDGAGDALAEEERVVTHAPGFFQRPADGRTSEGVEAAVRASATQWVDLSAFPDAHALEVQWTLDRTGPAVPKLYWRAFLARIADDAHAKARDRSLSPQARAALDERFLTPPSMLPESVRLDLLRRTMEPAPPLGQQNDILQTTLYMRRENGATSAPTPGVFRPMAGGWPVSPTLPATLRLDAETAIELGATDADGKPMPVEMRWLDAAQIQQRTWPATPVAQPLADTLKAGVYEFRSPRPGALRIRARVGGASLLPDGARLSYQPLAPGAPIHYDIHPIGQAPSRVRVSLRPTATRASVHLSAIGVDGREVWQDTIALTAQPSPFERAKRTPDALANAETQREIALPAAAVLLRLESDAPTLASLAAMPDTPAGAISPNWFAFLPRERDRLVPEIIVRQPAWPPVPPTTGLDVLALQPEGLVASQLFVTPETAAPATDAASPGRLHSLGAGELRITPAHGEQPVLVWIAATRTPSRARLSLDGQPFTIAMAGGSGQTTLPRPIFGAHRLRLIDGAGARWMVSHAATSDWRLRRLWRLSDDRPWTLRVAREGRRHESLHLLVFSPADAAPTALRVEFALDAETSTVEASRSLETNAPTAAWPLWQPPHAWRGPDRWVVPMPDRMAAGATARVRVLCTGCRNVRALAYRMSTSLPAPPALRARPLDTVNDAL